MQIPGAFYCLSSASRLREGETRRLAVEMHGRQQLDNRDVKRVFYLFGAHQCALQESFQSKRVTIITVVFVLHSNARR